MRFDLTRSMLGKPLLSKYRHHTNIVLDLHRQHPRSNTPHVRSKSHRLTPPKYRPASLHRRLQNHLVSPLQKVQTKKTTKTQKLRRQTLHPNIHHTPHTLHPNLHTRPLPPPPHNAPNTPPSRYPPNHPLAPHRTLYHPPPYDPRHRIRDALH